MFRGRLTDSEALIGDFRVGGIVNSVEVGERFGRKKRIRLLPLRQDWG